MNNARPVLPTPRLTPMTQFGLISIKGPDTEKFLQGQCTCDISQAEEGKLLIGAHCNAKGRMLFTFTAAKIGDDEYGLRVRSCTLQSSLEALQKYSVFSKVSLSISTLIPTAILGKNLDQLKPLPSSQAGHSNLQDELILCRHELCFLEVWASPERTAALTDNLKDCTTPGQASELDAHLIEQGIADVTAVTSGLFVPQALNYELINGVSFTKGCYTGQEIVARMQYKGKLKKHVYRAFLESSTPINIGDHIATKANPDKTAGTIVALSPTAKTTGKDSLYYQALIATSEEYYTGDAALIEKNSLASITWAKLPYPVN